MTECTIGQIVRLSAALGAVARGTQGRVVLGGSRKALVQFERATGRPLILDVPLALLQPVDPRPG